MRIAVAVSGGTDSLAAVVLLKDQGHEVVAVHGRFLDGPDPSPDPRGELGRILDALGVELVCLDLRHEFRQAVIEPFAAAYLLGRTPNPCAACNRAVKFGLLLDVATDPEGMGCRALATGHYARLEDRPGPAATGRILRRGADPTKDQSYFLSLVPAERLARAAMPLGERTKAEARLLLEHKGITPPLPAESQEICFVPRDDYRAFLESMPDTDLLPGPGPILLLDRATGDEIEVGSHQGLWRHTQGQRRGLGVAWAEPLYVLDKDPGRNALVVGTAPQAMAGGCRAGQVNILVPPHRWPDTILAQTRYRQQARPATAQLENDILTVIFNEPRGLPAPGQVVTLYAPDGMVLAGGVITEVL